MKIFYSVIGALVYGGIGVYLSKDLYLWFLIGILILSFHNSIK